MYFHCDLRVILGLFLISEEECLPLGQDNMLRLVRHFFTNYHNISVRIRFGDPISVTITVMVMAGLSFVPKMYAIRPSGIETTHENYLRDQPGVVD
jgi:hypothetical protein